VDLFLAASINSSSSIDLIQLHVAIFDWGPFHLIYTPLYGREFLRGFGKAVSEGLCASASFDLCVFLRGKGPVIIYGREGRGIFSFLNF
jgi:hypothetical protein